MSAKRRRNELDELLQDAVKFMDWPSNAGPTNARILIPDEFDIPEDILDENHSEPSTSTSELRQRQPKQREKVKKERPVKRPVERPVEPQKPRIPLFCQKPAEQKPRPLRLNLLSIVEETQFVPKAIPPPAALIIDSESSETEFEETDDEVIVLDDDSIESDQSATTINTFNQVFHPLMMATGHLCKAPVNSSGEFLKSRRFIIGAPSANLSV